jgi:hypothetical protein
VIGTLLTALSRYLTIKQILATERARLWLAAAKAKYNTLSSESKRLAMFGAGVFILVVLFL